MVTPREAFTSDLAPGTKSIDAALLARVRAVPGVRRAEGQLTESGSLVIGGEAVSTGFAPSVVSSASEKPFDAFHYLAGGPPRRAGEVVVDRQLASDQGLRVGQHVGLSTRSGVQRVVISGIATVGGRHVARRRHARGAVARPTSSAGSSAPASCRASPSPPRPASRPRAWPPRCGRRCRAR